MFWLRLTKLCQIILDPYLLLALIRGTAAGTEHKKVLKRLNLDFIVDVGANRGQFALIVRKVFPQAKIISFEPLQEPAKIFRKIFAVDTNVTINICAIGKEETTADIHMANNDDSSSLLPISEKQTEIFRDTRETGLRQVPVLTLPKAIESSSIPEESLLKIDVQGFELDVLQGSEEILNKFSYLYIECSFVKLYEGQALAGEIISWLNQREFTLSSIHNIYYEKNGNAVQGDFLFTKLSRAA